MNEDVQRPLDGDATAVLIATINGIQSGIQKANDPVVECDHKEPVELRKIMKVSLIPRERLSVAGFAEFHPVASNATPEGRAENRRVDLIILPRTKLNFAAAPVSAPDGPWARIIDTPRLRRNGASRMLQSIPRTFTITRLRR